MLVPNPKERGHDVDFEPRLGRDIPRTKGQIQVLHKKQESGGGTEADEEEDWRFLNAVALEADLLAAAMALAICLSSPVSWSKNKIKKRLNQTLGKSTITFKSIVGI